MEEIWKDIEGYEGLYQVSNYGRVRSFRQGKRDGLRPVRILQPTISNTGYEQITLYRNPQDRHKHLVHRIVAKAFVENPNPEAFDYINHKDENRLNNKAENLEWCTLSYNNAYGTARIRQSITKGRRVKQFTLEGILLATYESPAIAAEITGISKTVIGSCCSGECQSGKGYIWRYEADQ